MKKTVITLIIILLSGNLFGQPGKSRGPGGQYSERMEMMIVWKLTDELELSEKQAEKFFPIMRSHQQLIKDIRRDEKDLFEPLYTKVKKGKKVSQQEVNNLLKNISSLDDKKTKERVNFIQNSGKVLEPTQQFKLLMFNPQMKAQVQKDIIKRYRPSPGGKKRYNKRF